MRSFLVMLDLFCQNLFNDTNDVGIRASMCLKGIFFFIFSPSPLIFLARLEFFIG